MKAYRVKIAEGTTADFASPLGFVIENRIVRDSDQDDGYDPWEGMSGTYAALYDEPFRHLEGKLLTLCDATFTNKEQRESFKSILKDNLWAMFNEQTNITGGEFKTAPEVVPTKAE